MLKDMASSDDDKLRQRKVLKESPEHLPFRHYDGIAPSPLSVVQNYGGRRFRSVMLIFGLGLAVSFIVSLVGRRSMGIAVRSPARFELMRKWRVSPDSWRLRFALPSGQKTLRNDLNIPTCISVRYVEPSTQGDGKEEVVLNKSYSPISNPSKEGSFDLLVKAYTPRLGGGVGTYLTSLEVGETIIASVKAERMVHGSPLISHRWKQIGLVAGGTGVAPLIQLIRICLDNPHDEARIRLLVVDRREEDILMRDELDRLATKHARFSVAYSLTGGDSEGDWEGETGRGSVEMARRTLPLPAGGDGSTMIFVCGKLGFVETWGGAVGRAPPLADGTKGPKIQGPLLGFLAEVGFVASEVFKY